MEVAARRWGREDESSGTERRGKGEGGEGDRRTGTGEVGIADGDGDGRVNVLALALGHGELRPTTQGSSSLLCTERAGERNAQGGGREAAGGSEAHEERSARGRRTGG